jgi:predicted ArsR family transcriptional regulator
VPALRLAIIDKLYHADGELTTTAVGEAVEHPSNTTRRALEDLTAHGIVERATHGQGRADTWWLSVWASERYEAALTFPETSGEASVKTFPEVSEGVYSRSNTHNTALDDFSGKVP